MKDDPCFRCELPDCDWNDHGCLVRKLSNTYRTKQKNGLHDDVSEHERQGANERFKLWLIDSQAAASEGTRAWPRGRVPARLKRGRRHEDAR